MKILYDVSMLGHGHALPFFRTGIFRVVENLALGLYRADNCQTTFCTSASNYSNCRSYLDSYQDLKGYKLSQPTDLLSYIYSYAEPIRVEISKLPEKNWKAPLRNFYYFGKKYVRSIERTDIESADIFHSPASPIPERLLSERNITKFITIHDLIPIVHPEYCNSAGTDYMNAILDSIKPDTFVTCDSEATKQDFMTCMPFFDPAMVSVIYLAAGSEFHCCTDEIRIQQIRQKYEIPAESRYFLALSTLQPRKNFERIIKSFVQLQQQENIQDLFLVLVGANGWSYDQIYKEVDSAGELAGKIILTGYVPDEDLAPLYSGAIAFLYPSLYEGFGLPPLEAMQCGTPVITSNNSSLPEVVGDAAVMIDPRDEDAICQAMLDICNDEGLRQRLSVLSIERAKTFDWDKTTSETLKAYKKALQF